jgi:hypothetical protein
MSEIRASYRDLIRDRLRNYALPRVRYRDCFIQNAAKIAIRTLITFAIALHLEEKTFHADSADQEETNGKRCLRLRYKIQSDDWFR